MSLQIEVSREQIIAFCKRWQIAELAFFGSVLRDDFRPDSDIPDSDIDVMVRFQPEASHSLFSMVSMEEELSGILGRETDLVSRTAVEKSRNYIRREAVLKSAEVFYAA